MSDHEHLSPAAVWSAMEQGNRRFAAGEPTYPRQDAARRLRLRQGQKPSAVVLSCSDSRVPVEHIFDAGFGDLFVVRTAGEILDESVMGTISYGVNSLGVPLVVVLGHEGCGAVKASAEALAGGHLPEDHQRVLVERVAPSILLAQAEGVTSMHAFERRHAKETASQLMQRMPRLSAKVRAGEVGLVSARYQLDSGLVEVISAKGFTDTPSGSAPERA